MINRVLMFSTIIILLAAHAYSFDITVVTENYPPYNYSENGAIKGISTEVVQAVLKELGVKAQINVYPWARTYRMALDNPNTLIYSLGRTPQREHLFKWVGVIAPADQVLFRLKDRKDIKAATLNDLKKYKIGTVRDDLIEHYLLANGFKIGENIDQCDNYDQLMKKLFGKRFDLCAVGQLVGIDIIAKQGVNPELLVKAFRFDEISNGVNMAFQKDTADDIVNKFRQALDKIKTNKTYDKIISKYHMGASDQ